MKSNSTVLPAGIYGITAERFSRGRSNIAVVEAMIAGGIKIIQYREKRRYKPFKEIFEECKKIREITKLHNVKFIVNDFVDIALLVDADGVHVGQEDLPVEAVRRLVGPEKIIGLSTHSAAQAAAAEAAGADYIGVGPLYETQTKEDVCGAVGLEYLDYVVGHCPLPFVAIGGIKRHNIGQVARHGAKTICLVTEIVGAEDIPGTIQDLGKALQEGQG
ncbi:MAG: thiamine phosphate synthase [Desulforhopalus sp.]